MPEPTRPTQPAQPMQSRHRHIVRQIADRGDEQATLVCGISGAVPNAGALMDAIDAVNAIARRMLADGERTFVLCLPVHGDLLRLVKNYREPTPPKAA